MPQKELDLTILEMLELEDLINMDIVQFTDDILPDKPHPAKMEKIFEDSVCDSAIFIGDSIDDFLTSYNYNNLRKGKKLIFGLVADKGDSFPDEARKFQADSVNDLISYLIDKTNKQENK